MSSRPFPPEGVLEGTQNLGVGIYWAGWCPACCKCATYKTREATWGGKQTILADVHGRDG